MKRKSSWLTGFWALAAGLALILGATVEAKAASAKRTLTLSGSPATSVAAGVAYSFKPTASDPKKNKLTFSIKNQPAWATFSTATGQLSGTPTAAQAKIYSNIVISVSSKTGSASLPAFAITVTSAASTNSAPTIRGTPATTVTAGSAYSFTPIASDANGDTLSFSITNKPSWATFSIVTGQLSGTPTTAQTGTYSNIIILVSDGKASTSLPAFTLTVNAANTGTGTSTGTATLSWLAPVQNTDGSALTNLAGYRVYHGTSATALTDVRTVSSPGITTWVFDQLTSGTHYFAISAVNTAGAEGPRTASISKKIP
jgi:hypothetical protein